SCGTKAGSSVPGGQKAVANGSAASYSEPDSATVREAVVTRQLPADVSIGRLQGIDARQAETPVRASNGSTQFTNAATKLGKLGNWPQFESSSENATTTCLPVSVVRACTRGSPPDPSSTVVPLRRGTTKAESMRR